MSKYVGILNRIDWDKLAQQKQSLVGLTTVGDRTTARVLSVRQLNALIGVINLIDGLQDEAEKLGIWEHPLADKEEKRVRTPGENYQVDEQLRELRTMFEEQASSLRGLVVRVATLERGLAGDAHQ